MPTKEKASVRSSKRKGRKRARTADGTLMYCDFCGKTQHEVHKLIAGPEVFICSECTDLAAAIVADGSPPEKVLPETRKILGLQYSVVKSLEELGLHPRFMRTSFDIRPNHCFLLGPFMDPFNTIYLDHIRPAVESVSFSIDRADEIFGTQPIIEDIWTSINTAQVIIADVTGRNPNVMYEVGMAHTVGRPTILITQDINDVPFDLKHHRCIIYDHTPRGCRQLEERIVGTLRFVRRP